MAPKSTVTHPLYQPDPGAERALVLVMIRADLAAFLRTLSRREQQVVCLVFWLDLTLADAARMLCVTRQTAHEHLQRALAKGRLMLSDYAGAA